MKIYWNKENNSKNLIGQRVKELRTEKHISQKALAEQLQLAGYEFSDLTVYSFLRVVSRCYVEELYPLSCLIKEDFMPAADLE